MGMRSRTSEANSPRKLPNARSRTTQTMTMPPVHRNCSLGADAMPLKPVRRDDLIDAPKDRELVRTAVLEEASVSHDRFASDRIALAQAHLPELILMDIQLPGIDGLAATRLLKKAETTRHIKVIAMSASAMKDDEKRVFAAGCDGFIVKPIPYRSFLEEVETTLALPAGQPQGTQ